MLVAGLDEAGRGPLAGPVIAGAVILDPKQPIEGLMDSKKLSVKKRESLFEQIKEKALAWALGRAEVQEIDQLNILQASLLAMQRAIQGLTIQPDKVLVDGNQAPQLPMETITIIQGDAKEPAISAASILAKVTRDRELIVLDEKFPEYGLKVHKGYPTKQHLEALKLHGASEIHRRTFRPVQKVLQASHLEGVN